jgi:hypothetical protein
VLLVSLSEGGCYTIPVTGTCLAGIGGCEQTRVLETFYGLPPGHGDPWGPCPLHLDLGAY